MKLYKGRQLATKDGRKIGNAIISEVLPNESVRITTDFGNKSILDPSEVEEFFHTDFEYNWDRKEGNLERWIGDRKDLISKPLYIKETDVDEIFTANPDFHGAVLYSEMREISGKKYICFNATEMSSIWNKGDFHLKYGDLEKVPDSWHMEELRGSEVIYRPVEETE